MLTPEVSPKLLAYCPLTDSFALMFNKVAGSLDEIIEIVSGLSAIVVYGNYANTVNIKSLECGGTISYSQRVRPMFTLSDCSPSIC